MTIFLDEFIHQIRMSSKMPPSFIEEFVKGFENLDWDLAIRRNRDQLRQIVLALFALAGCLTSPLRGEVSAKPTERGFPFFLPRSTIAMIMLVLRPAESAVRRLIVIVAAGLVLKSTVRSGVDFGRLANLPPCGGDVAEGDRGGYNTFALFDALKSYDPDSIWDADPAYQSGYSLTKSTAWHDASADHTPVDATHIGLRLNAILRALNDLSRQARRLKRWELKRDELLKSLTLRVRRTGETRGSPRQREPRRAQPWRPTRLFPMRPGLPPGWRERKVHEIDNVLKECHRLANDRLDSG